MTSRPTRFPAHLVALAIVVLGLSLRVPGMIGWWINPDEGAYFSMVTWDEWGSFWEEVKGHVHPPLYYLLLRLMGLVSHEFFWLRSLALISGLVSIVLAWRVGREVDEEQGTGWAMASLAALVVAVAPGPILISQLIRPYALLVALSLAAFLAQLRFRRLHRSRSLVGYSLLVSLALLTHYSGALILASLSALFVVDLLAGHLRRDLLPRVVLAHLPPLLIGVGLYYFHVRLRLMRIWLEDEAFTGWLDSYLIHSVSDVWLNLMGFFGYLAGPRLAGPALLVFLVGMALALWRRSWPVAVTGSAALAIAILGAAAGKYPFGACRQASWLFGFLILPLAWMPTVAFTRGRKVAWVTAGVLVLLGVAGPGVGRILGSRQAVLEPKREHVIWRGNLEASLAAVLRDSRAEVVLLSYQTYYLLLPVMEAEREAAVDYPEAGFHRFTWQGREVLVDRAWRFAVHPDLIDRPEHLYNVIQAIDRELPELRLPERRQVLMMFGGWLESTPVALERANRLLPADEPLARPLTLHEGFRAYDVDLAKFDQWFAGHIAASTTPPSD